MQSTDKKPKGWVIVSRKEKQSILIFDENGKMIAEISINSIFRNQVSLGIRSNDGQLSILRTEKYQEKI